MVAGVSVMWLLFFRINTVEQKSEESVWASKGTGNALILYQKSRFSLTQDTVICMAEGLQKEGYSVVANHPRHDVPYEIQDLIWLHYALLCMVEQFRGRYWIMHPAMIFRGKRWL